MYNYSSFAGMVNELIHKQTTEQRKKKKEKNKKEIQAGEGRKILMERKMKTIRKKPTKKKGKGKKGNEIRVVHVMLSSQFR